MKNNKILLAGLILSSGAYLSAKHQEDHIQDQASVLTEYEQYQEITRCLAGLNLASCYIPAKIKDVNLSNTIFECSNLAHKDMAGFILIGTKFKGANLDQVENLDAAIYKKCTSSTEYDKAKLDSAQIRKILVAGGVICQTHYSEQEIDKLARYDIKY